MTTLRLLSFLILSSILVSCNEDDGIPVIEKPEEPESVRYSVKFDALWSQQTHPAEFPSSAHFSGLIGATHTENVHLFELDQLASPGIKSMAETGSKNALKSEIEALMNSGDADFLIDGPGIGRSPGEATIEIDVQKSHPYVTITSMIAPSPDWFIAVSDVNLFEDDSWIATLELEVGAYDSGTDSGTTFTSANEVTDPYMPVHEINSGPLFLGGFVATMGTITFTRIE